MEIRSPETDEEWDMYYDLRYRILREPLDQPRGSERNELDAIGVHFALFENDRICAIARLDQADEITGQVRFVAVDDIYRGKGYGRLIMDACENASQERGDLKMMLQARDYAVDFYEHIGYTLKEETHLLFGVLQHFKMEKNY